MNNLKRFLAGLLSITAMMTAAVSCSDKDSSSSENNEHYKSEDDFAVSADEEIKGENDVDISGQTIYWLADYDLNPTNNNDRSVALSLFEDVYGGKIEWIQADSNEKFSTLAQRILAGDPVDMFPYEWDAVPNGVSKNQYQPLDPYYDILEMDTDLWEDMTDVIDMFEYKDSHYVIPYAISDPLIITYSRKMMEAEGLEDPYELYEDGEWDWDAMM
ncbi:MAG: extracellular solute-binding protein, partial [Ruminococcus sp.]|nr:extracellular solute-binding protein [Ruminococcus sp.]